MSSGASISTLAGGAGTGEGIVGRALRDTRLRAARSARAPPECADRGVSHRLSPRVRAAARLRREAQRVDRVRAAAFAARARDARRAGCLARKTRRRRLPGRGDAQGAKRCCRQAPRSDSRSRRSRSCFFAPDGRGYPRLIVDLLHLMEAGDRSEAFLAHELFHSFRNRIARRARQDSGDDLLMAALGNAEDEGTADQLDKADIPDMPPRCSTERFPEPARVRTTAPTRTNSGAPRTGWNSPNGGSRSTPAILRRPTTSARGCTARCRTAGASSAPSWRGRSSRKLGQDRLLETVGDPIGFWRALPAGPRWLPQDAPDRFQPSPCKPSKSWKKPTTSADYPGLPLEHEPPRTAAPRPSLRPRT